MVRKKKRVYGRKTRISEKKYGFFMLNKLKITLFAIFVIFYLVYLYNLNVIQSLNMSWLSHFVFILIGWPILVMENIFGLIIGLVWIYFIACLLGFVRDIVKKR